MNLVSHHCGYIQNLDGPIIEQLCDEGKRLHCPGCRTDAYVDSFEAIIVSRVLPLDEALNA